jgi:hypothetical protein
MKRKEYLDKLQSRQEMMAAFNLWNEEGLRDGIDMKSMG